MQEHPAHVAGSRVPVGTGGSQKLVGISEVDSLLENGRELHRQGHLAEAFRQYQLVLSIEPKLPQAWHLLGVATLQQGDVPAAIELLKKAVQLDPGVAGYHRNLGEALQASGDFPAAVLSLEQALRLDPLHPGTWASLSESLMQMGEATPALDCLSQALQLNPNHLQSRLLLGNAQKQLGELATAAANYRFVLSHEPGNIAAAVNLAAVLRGEGETQQAVQLLRRVVERGANSPAIFYNLANTLADLGEFEEACQRYREALPNHPQPSKVLFNLSAAMKFKANDREQLEQWESIARSRMNTNDDAVHLHFALGKAHDDLGEFSTAFDHYQQGNRLVPVTFDPAAHWQEIRNNIDCWSAEFVRSRLSWGDETTAPVFIVGMPRSGTTLVEQLLGSHSQVQALGERTQMGKLVAEHADSIGSGNNLAVAARMSTQADIYSLGQDYLQDIQLSENKSHFTDKMPTNFLLLGWIATCFPQATIIHCLRDPRDACLSCYFQHFTHRLPFTYDLGHLAAYYHDYEQLMAHWQRVLPGRIFDVRYEDLVESPEVQARMIFDHCRLNWEAEVLQSHAVDRAVRTASGWQVRQPIYKSSKQRWMNYQEHIQPLLDAFGK